MSLRARTLQRVFHGCSTPLPSHSSRCAAPQEVRVDRAHVAQSAEHLHGKEKVIGSIPIVGSIARAGCGLSNCALQQMMRSERWSINRIERRHDGCG